MSLIRSSYAEVTVLDRSKAQETQGRQARADWQRGMRLLELLPSSVQFA